MLVGGRRHLLAGCGVLSVKGAVGSPSGGPGSHITAAGPTDPRCSIIDLHAAPYHCPTDGAAHFLTEIGLSAAVSAYPNANISVANVASMSRATAAFLQAEHDARVGSGGNIRIRFSCVATQTWALQKADKVFLSGPVGGAFIHGRLAVAAGLPVIALLNVESVCEPLCDIGIFAKDSPVYFPANAGGTPCLGYVAGAVAVRVDNCQGMLFRRVGYNGFDRPYSWGNHVFGIGWKNCGGSGNNIGWNWDQTTTLDSMERIFYADGALANNNYNFDINTVHGGALADPTKPESVRGGFSQGGSIWIDNVSMDYPVVRQGRYIGKSADASDGSNSLHISRSHIETTGACSGSKLCRFLAQGAITFNQNEFYENDGGVPPGLVEVSDGCASTMTACRVNNNSLPLHWSGTATAKRVTSTGNIAQNPLVRLISLRDTNGDYMQDQGASQDVIKFDPGLISLAEAYGNRYTLSYAVQGSCRLPSDAEGNFPIGSYVIFDVVNQPVTFVGTSGTGATVGSFPGGTTTFFAGSTPKARKDGHNSWLMSGSSNAPAAFPMRFVGTAETRPMGVQTFTGATAAGLVYDGSGNLRVPVGSSGDLSAAGIIADGRLVEVDLASATPNRAFFLRYRAQSDGSALALYVTVNGKLYSCTLNSNGGGSNFQSVDLDSSTVNSFGFMAADRTVNTYINGNAFHDFTVNILTPGYLGFAGNGRAATLISTIKVS